MPVSPFPSQDRSLSTVRMPPTPRPAQSQSNPHFHARVLSFSAAGLSALALRSVGTIDLPGETIVINPNPRPIAVPGDPADQIPPFGAALLRQTQIQAAHTILTIAFDHAGIFPALATGPDWTRLDGLPDVTSPAARDLPLYRSAQDHIVAIQSQGALLSPGLSHQRVPQCWQLYANLWFAPAGTACLIHNRHPFLEFHVQISGIGSMQKFRRNDPGTLFENQRMAPGNAHRIYAVQDEGDGSFRYPWHQYYAETDCVWLAVELVPTARARVSALPPSLKQESDR